jgi:Raf kinase inhibitor-like YbhB/YbcL family protein
MANRIARTQRGDWYYIPRRYPAMVKTIILPALSTLLFSGNPLAAAAKLEVTSPAFGEGKSIPKKYTGRGKNVSPPLKWGKVPEGTKSIAVLCEDPDAPKKKPWVHWVLFNLPADAKELSEGVKKRKTLPSRAKQGKNDSGKIGYSGPNPPSGTHRYFFKVYALDKKLSLKAGSTRKKLLAKMEGHILAEGELMGKVKK